MTTFKIVFTFDVFFSAETTMHCKVTCILYKKQAHFSRLFCLNINNAKADICKKMIKFTFKDVSTKNSELTYWTILFVMRNNNALQSDMYFI
jgi:hypothetical protein